jgi:hypothetical protein
MAAAEWTSASGRVLVALPSGGANEKGCASSKVESEVRWVRLRWRSRKPQAPGYQARVRVASETTAGRGTPLRYEPILSFSRILP